MNLVDRILYNGNIITLDADQPRVSALAIASGRIVAYGSDDDILPLASAGTISENLNDKFVIPGLTDAHIHWEWTARNLNAVDVFEVSSKQLAVDRIAERVAKSPVGNWVSGSGWFQDLWPDRAFPSAADLDAVSPHHPVYLTATAGRFSVMRTVSRQAFCLKRLCLLWLTRFPTLRQPNSPP
jgi:predicted amidohydrolase YtcJ